MTKPESNWRDELGCIGTVYDPDPTLKGYMIMTTAEGTGLDRYNSRLIVNSLSEVDNDSSPNVDNNASQRESTFADTPESRGCDSPERDLDDELESYDVDEDFLIQAANIDSQTTFVASSNKNARQSLTTNAQPFSSTVEQSSAVEPKKRRVLPGEPLSNFRILPVQPNRVFTTQPTRVFPSQTNRVLPTASSSSNSFSPSNKRTLPTQPTTPNKRVLPGQSDNNRRVLPNQLYAENYGPPAQRTVNYTLESNKLYEALSDEQKSVYDVIMDGRSNVFFTGSAGTGKSVLLRALISKFRVMYTKDEVAITASTGIAAVNIEGTTIHTFANVGFGEKPAQEYVNSIRKNRGKVTKFNAVRVLIVDEISMLDGRLLDKIEFVCRSVRNNLYKPFGGIRVIFCGDFFQLPPVVKNGGSLAMAFEAECWDRVIDKCFILKKTFRQTDSEFIAILNDIRRGAISRESEHKLQLLSRTPHLEADIEQTELYSLRSQVDRANREKLDRLPGEAQIYQATDSADPAYISELNNIMAPKELILKKDTQVMLIKNLSSTLVNGSIGKVIGFQDITDDDPYANKLPIVHFLNGETRVLGREDWKREVRGKQVACRTQVPLMLAWAMSIHKSQGQTIPYAKINLNNTFEIGQVYVALSRATGMDKLQVLNFSANAVKVNPKVAQFYRKLEANV